MFTALLNAIYSFLQYIIALFPVGSGFPGEVHTAFSSLGGYLHILDPLVPISTLLSCVTLIFTVEIAIFGFKSFNWVKSHLPFIGGK